MARPFEENTVSGARDGAQAARPHVPHVSNAGSARVAARVGSLVVTDSSRLFMMVAALSWMALVLAPLLASIAFDASWSGAPLLGVVLWLAFLRTARWLSPAARADMLLRRGRYAAALAMSEQSLAVTGDGAWVGPRRLVWLNRRATALLGLGRSAEALAAALDALDASPDPETIANCSVALLRLNRYEMAIEMARVVGQLTHERSVRANATLAWGMLARGMPAEAEAVARVSLEDIQALTPYVRRENYAAILSALCRAQRALGLRRQASATLARLRRVTKGAPALAAVALLEEAEFHEGEPRRAAELLAAAHSSDSVYTDWYLTQPGSLAFLRAEPEVAARIDQVAQSFERMNAATPGDDVLRRLLHWGRLVAHQRPTYQSSAAALVTQVATLCATLALLLLWMWRFFISQSL